MLVDQLNKTETEKKMLEQAKQQAEVKIRQDYEAKLNELENGMWDIVPQYSEDFHPELYPEL